MRLGGRTLQEYVSLLAPLLALITAVALMRLILYELFESRWVVRPLSVTFAIAVCVPLAAFLIHHRRFGGYVNVIVATFFLVTWGHLLIVLFILFAILTGTENVFTIRAFSGPPGFTVTQHIIGHLTFGIGIGNLMGGAIACVFFFLLRVFERNEIRADKL